jgi:hypothetical protein
LRRGLKLEAAFIKMSKVGNDGEPKSGPGLGLIETLPSFDGLGPLGFG